MLWSKDHIIALVIIGAVLWAMYKFSGLKIWHALVVLAIGAYLTAFIFGPQISGFLAAIIVAVGGSIVVRIILEALSPKDRS